jgi:antitoxin component YwqK of YwqJK toxin-antitoxin module
MKRFIYWLAVCVLYLGALAYAQDQRSVVSLQTLGLQGSVRSIEEKYPSVSSGQLSDSPFVIRKTFALSGYLQDEVGVDTDSQTISYKSEYLYIPSGTISEIKTYTGNTLDIHERAYFDNGLWTHSYIRNPQNEIVFVSARDSNLAAALGDLKTPFLVYFFDEQQKVITAQYFSAKNSLSVTSKWTYDAQGRTSSSWTEGSDGLQQSKFTYTHDALGRMNELRANDSQGRLSTRTIYTFDTNGNVKTEETFNAQGQVTQYLEHKYVYDSKNNWTRNEVYMRNSTDQTLILQSATLRVITYF